MKAAGQAKALTRRVITHASALPSLAFARREKSQSTRLARSARLAGQRRTKRATVSQQLASVNLQRNYPRPARAPRFVLDAPNPLANAQQKHAGLVKGSTQHETTLAIVSLSWASATKEKSPCTRLGKSARLAGPRRTRHACASQHLAFATQRVLWSDHNKLPFLSAAPASIFRLTPHTTDFATSGGCRVTLNVFGEVGRSFVLAIAYAQADSILAAKIAELMTMSAWQPSLG